jgi:hypothetical protein
MRMTRVLERRLCFRQSRRLDVGNLVFACEELVAIQGAAQMMRMQAR